MPPGSVRPSSEVKPRASLERAASAGLARWAVAVLIAAMLIVPAVGLLIARAYTFGFPQIALPSGWTAPAHDATRADARKPALYGRILTADGDPVQGASVRVVLSDAPYTLLEEVPSDPAGAFAFARAGTAPVRVVADREPEGAVSSAEIRVPEGRSIELTLVLVATSSVRGDVVDADGHPVAGATLSLDGSPWMTRQTSSDTAGAFRLAAVPADATSLFVIARGYRAAHVALAPHQVSRELVVHIQLAAGPSVQGDVRDADGRPVKARVVACEGQPAEVKTTSGDDGTFTLAPAAIGCDVIAEHDEYAPSDAVHVVEGRRISLRLKAGGSIQGTVVDERGAGVPSFSLGIEVFYRGPIHESGGRGQRKVEDPQGAFRWDKLAPGSYVLTATVTGKPPARSEVVEVRAGVATTGVQIVLAAGGLVIGHVYDDHRVPLAGVDLHFDAVSSAIDSAAEAKTNDAGEYRLEGAPAGPFTLRIHKDGYRLRLLSGLRVEAGRSLTQDVILSNANGGHGLEFGGIGATLVQNADGVVLSSVFDDAPAARAGLRTGDRVTRIDGDDTEGMSLADALQRLRGQEGSVVGVSVSRPKTGESLDVLVTRATIVH